jgi:hypothetical protein
VSKFLFRFCDEERETFKVADYFGSSILGPVPSSETLAQLPQFILKAELNESVFHQLNRCQAV